MGQTNPNRDDFTKRDIMAAIFRKVGKHPPESTFKRWKTILHIKASADHKYTAADRDYLIMIAAWFSHGGTEKGFHNQMAQLHQ
jgi:hypothetical protein